MSHLTQMVGLHRAELRVRRGRAWRSRSPSSGASCAAGAATLGNFWVDLVARRPCASCCPSSLVVAVVLGRPGRGAEPERQHRRRHGGPSVTATVTQRTAPSPRPVTEQAIPGGPVASQEAIKQLGTNGGGFFNANSAHPFENPNGLDQPPPVLPAPADPVRLPGDVRPDARPGPRQGWVLLGVMAAPRWCRRCSSRSFSETSGNPMLTALGVDQSQLVDAVAAATWRARRCASAPASCGLFGRRHHRHLHRLGQLHARLADARPVAWLPMLHMMLGEISPGGVGVGL